MQTRRDHIQAYQFSAGRLVHAVTAGDPGTGEQPFRRGNLGVILGTVIGLLLSGGAVVYGLISPAADTSWKSQGSMIVEKETGTRYILLDGVLRPTANYVSARLASGAKPTVHMVAHSALSAFPIGSQIGIAGAPDTLPAPAALLDGKWSLCLGSAGSGADTVLDLVPAGHTDPVPPHQPILVAQAPDADTSATTSGTSPGGTTNAADTKPGNAGKPNDAGKSGNGTGTGNAGDEYVLWGPEKFPVPNPSVLAALGLGDLAPLQAPAAWLGLFPTGDPLGPAPIQSANAPGPKIAGRPARVGALFQTTAGGVDQFYVLLTDGLAPITRTEAALFETVHGVGQPATVDPSDIAAAPVSGDQSLLGRVPDLLSSAPFAPSGARLCAYQAKPGSTAGPVLVTEADGYFPDASPVLLPAGHALIAESTSVDAATSQPTVYLITDTGQRFTLDGGDAYQALGFSGAPGHVLPDAVLALVHGGPTLSVTAARKAVTWSAG